MGGGGGVSATPTTQTTIQKTELPKWVEDASESNYNFAKQIADKPYTAYEGKTLADTPEALTQAYNLFKNGMGSGSTEIAKANSMITKAGGGILGLNRDDYMNPMLEQVVGGAMSDLEKQRLTALAGNADAAQKAKAFGGNRAAVLDAVTNAETADKAGRLSAQLRSDAFDKSSALMNQDLANMFAGGQGLLAGGQALDAARMKEFTGLQTIGQQQQAAEQAGLDDARAKWEDKDNYDLERLNILMSSLGMSPYGKSESSTSTGQQLSQKSSPDYASAAMGTAMMAMMMFSDRNEKTDIKKLGKDPVSGLPMYAYRYKGDPKTYPKVVGPMAQDIEKAYPGAVSEIGGKKVVRGILANG